MFTKRKKASRLIATSHRCSQFGSDFLVFTAKRETYHWYLVDATVLLPSVSTLCTDPRSYAVVDKLLSLLGGARIELKSYLGTYLGCSF